MRLVKYISGCFNHDNALTTLYYTGLYGRNSVIAAFVFSLVLVILSCLDIIPLFLYLKQIVNRINSREGSQEGSPGVYTGARQGSLDMTEKASEPEEPEQRHKGVNQ